MKILTNLQHKYALSEQGAKDMAKVIVSVTASDLVLMLPVGLLYRMTEEILNGTFGRDRIPFYRIGCLICLALIGFTTWIQYNATFLATYVESGIRRTNLAEKLRKLPLPYFGKKDLADLTSTIMADCATIETC